MDVQDLQHSRPVKTCKVNDLVDTANRILRQSAVGQSEKSGVCSFIESVLHATNNYNGFCYLSWDTEKTTEENKKTEYSRQYSAPKK